MSGGVFVLKDGKTLVEMKPATFMAEDDFQRLLADFPSLLAGAQIDSAQPRRWLLVRREMSIASDQDGAGRWSVDHLFLDQDGIPTLVEVKRQSDTRIRREVVGQMLDYAANGVVYWPVEEIRSQFEANCAAASQDASALLSELVGIDGDAAAYWQTVKTNLQAGRIRMLFVADVIPPELRRIVEFLNTQMDPAEVLALELRQYEGEGLKTLVPIIYGKTEEAQTRKAPTGPKRQWDENSIFVDMQQRAGLEAVRVGHQIAEWIKAKSQVLFGQGARDGSMNATVTRQGVRLDFISLWSYGKVMLSFGSFAKPPFGDESIRREWLARMNAIPGIKLPDDAISRWPTLPLRELSDEGRLREFLTVADWLIDRLKAA
jgi:hypothetical protein